MSPPPVLRIYLENALRKRAEAGRHNFLNLVASVAGQGGLEVRFHLMRDLAFARPEDGYALVHMQPPPHEHALTFRRVYHYPFWQIERSAQRWMWHVAHRSFDPKEIDPDRAKRFAHNWRRRIFGATETGDDGFVYVPLQGRLRAQRSFQTCSPIDMVRRVAAAFPQRRIICGLHPKEDYAPADLAELEKVTAAHPEIRIVTGGMEDLLPRCSCVISQNSSVAFFGYFLEKPAVLFAEIDFHHIALRGDDPECFAELPGHRPDYARYLYWFWQMNAINAGRPDAERKIAGKMRAAGWIT